MVEWIFDLFVVWHIVLIAILLFFARRTTDLVDRIVGFDALSLVFVSALAVIGTQRKEVFYFDIALVVAMLGFVQTVAAVRLLERRARLR